MLTPISLGLASQHLFGPEPLTALCDAAAAGALPRLAQLDLSHNPLTDAAAAALPRLLDPEAAWRLSELSLYGCMLGPKSAEQLAFGLAGAAADGSSNEQGGAGVLCVWRRCCEAMATLGWRR